VQETTKGTLTTGWEADTSTGRKVACWGPNNGRDRAQEIEACEASKKGGPGEDKQERSASEAAAGLLGCCRGGELQKGAFTAILASGAGSMHGLGTWRSHGAVSTIESAGDLIEIDKKGPVGKRSHIRRPRKWLKGGGGRG